MIDGFGREVSYLRLSVTDRCNMRCVYCMPNGMAFTPKQNILSLEELAEVAGAFVTLGVTKIRLTGGEPLMRRDVMWLVERLGAHLKSGDLGELTMTTNGSRLSEFAIPLFKAGVRRVNVSLDTLDDERFTKITKGGRLDDVLTGIQAARDADIQVKINCLALRGTNEDEFDDLVRWCGQQKFDLSFIEVMPMGDIGCRRVDQFVPLTDVRERLEATWSFQDTDFSTGGPSRYVRVRETGCLVGFISPLSKNFCAGCNRVRLTSDGRLFTCLGNEGAVDLRGRIREGVPATEAILSAIRNKPDGHRFDYDARESEALGETARTMNVTGG